MLVLKNWKLKSDCGLMKKCGLVKGDRLAVKMGFMWSDIDCSGGKF